MKRYLLVHGLGLSADIWSHLSPLLDGEVIARDLPGHGASRSQAYDWVDLWGEITSPVRSDQWAETVLLLHSFTAALISGNCIFRHTTRACCSFGRYLTKQRYELVKRYFPYE